MTYKATDFLALRNRIVKNTVLNKLLTATLLNQPYSVKVGSCLIPLPGKMRDMINKGPKTKFPRYILADIRVTLGSTLSVGYSYKDSPVITKSEFARPSGNRIVCLKHIAGYVCEAYSLHASKADKVFSKLPNSLRNLLECAKISDNFWKTGFSKRLKGASAADINYGELKRYGKTLEYRLGDWRCFNRILIGLVKNDRFEAVVPDFGKLTIEKTPLDMRMSCVFEPARGGERISEVVHCKDFNPVDWETANYAIDIFTIRKFFRE